MSNSTFQDRRHVLTYLDIFQSSTFSLRIRFPSTRTCAVYWSGIRIHDFLNPLSTEWKVLNTLRSGIAWTLNPFFFYPVWTSQDTMTQFFPWIFQDVAERNVIASFLLGLSVSSLITCVQLNLAMITVHFWLCQTAARHFEDSLHVGRTNWTP